MGEVKDENLDELAQELKNDEYPLPEEKERKEITYKDVDVTIKFKKETKEDAETDERVLFSDTGFGLSEMVYDESKGVLRVPIVLAKEMVYHYDDYDAFRPRDELKAIVSYLKGVPVTRGHPEAKIVTDRTEVEGWAIDAEFEDDELRVVLEIAEKSLIEDIQSGKLKGVSPGHFSRLDKAASGEYEGAHYDVTQRDLFIDHIAIVEEGRCSVADGCGIVVDEEVREKKDQKKKVEGDEGEIMEPKVVEKKVNAAIAVAETIEKKAEEEKVILEEVLKIEEVPAPAVAKVKKAIVIAGKIEDEVKTELKKDLEEAKEAVTGTKEPEDKKKDEVADEKEKLLDAAMKKIEAERDGLKTELDEIVKEEKTKLIDELKTSQDVKTEDQLKEMSLDGLKSDLELVKALRGNKFTVDDDGAPGAGSGAIRKAYSEVGKRGGRD